MSEATTDVLVLGDGPAGCMAALTLRRAGLHCTMLAPARPANRRGAIESVPPMVPRLLEAADLACDRFVDAIAGRFDGMVNEGVVRRFHSTPGATAGQGWHVQRGLFDRVLLDHATEQGVKLRRDRVTELVCTTKDVAVRTATLQHRARWLVDASGRSGMLRRLLGLAAVTRGARMLAWRGIMQTQHGSELDAVQLKPACAMPTFRASGVSWLWQAPLADGSIAWTWAGDAAEVTMPPSAAARGFDVSWRLVRPAGGATYRIVGDAAALLDPRSGQGVLFALWSALAAARSIIAVESAPHLRSLEAAGYDAFVATEFRRISDELMRRIPAAATPASQVEAKLV
jgi:flavin-dependent dehydrogenase